MTYKSNTYKQIILDYFKDFIRDVPDKKTGLLLCLIYLPTMLIYTIAFGLIYGFGQLNKNWLLGIPILFALISISFHTVSLPFMMYLIPYSKKQREEYIQKMLIVKITIPLIFACLSDIAAALFYSVSWYALILQMAGIFFITYICGILCEGNFFTVASETIPAYGKIQPWSGIFLVFCYFGSVSLFGICVDTISKTEFWVVFSVMVFVLLPISIVLHKHWKTIRSNFADYEMQIKRTNARFR